MSWVPINLLKFNKISWIIEIFIQVGHFNP
jgi:hypothetical protein